jgi:hypothetical protein
VSNPIPTILIHSTPTPDKVMGMVLGGSPTSKVTTVVAVTWLLVVLTGTLLMAQYSQTAGSSGAPPPDWPSASQIPRDPGLSTLVLVLHPRCPCSRATLGELEQLMAHCQGLLTVEVLFTQPAGMTEDWVKTDLWHTASAIPGVRVRIDHEGQEALRFQAATSGHALLYDIKGALMFQGGITQARGHAGDNPGRDAIESLLKQKNSLSVSTPVFGCALSEQITLEKCTTCQP